jgi:hypothetical protein
VAPSASLSGTGWVSITRQRPSVNSWHLSPDNTPDLWLPGVVFGGVIWGVALGRLSRIRRVWRLGLAGGLGVLLAELLATAPFFVTSHRALWPDAPNHVRWMMDLVIGLGLGGGVTALALGLAIHWRRAAVWLALGVGVVAALSALAINLSLDVMGIRWGAGHANMAKVVGLAFPVATIAAGALIGRFLAQFGQTP